MKNEVQKILRNFVTQANYRMPARKPNVVIVNEISGRILIIIIRADHRVDEIKKLNKYTEFIQELK